MNDLKKRKRKAEGKRTEHETDHGRETWGTNGDCFVNTV